MPTLGTLSAGARALGDNVVLRRIGLGLIMGAAAIFLVIAVRDAGSAAILERLHPSDLASLAAGGVFYALLLVLLARSWALAPARGRTGTGTLEAVAVYGTSILPKYIPGSVFQYGSRQALGARLGWRSDVMVQASALEIALHVLCSLAVAAALFVPSGQVLGVAGLGWWSAAIALALLVAIGGTAWLGRRLPNGVVVRSALYQLGFFAGLGALAAACSAGLGVEAGLLGAVAGLFLLAWLIGFVVPLAPGGLGVREASGVLLLSGLVSLEVALLLLASMRIVSLIGDVLLFAAGIACQRRLHFVI